MKNNSPLPRPHGKASLIKRLVLLTVISLVLAALLSGFSGCGNSPSESNDSLPSDNGSDLPADGKPAEPPKKRVAITFDDGPHNIWTKQIVNELGRYGYTATFFVVGNRVDGKAYNGGDTLAFVASQGHELAIHGYTHDVYYNSCSDAEYSFELSETAKVIGQWGSGAVPTLMRPIGGSISSERATACPYSVVLWSVDSEDWRYKYRSEDTPEMMQEKVDTIVNNVMSSVRDGSIILLHDIYESTYDATCIILERLYAEGYEVVSVSELLGDPQPGVTYRQRN